MQVLDVFLFFGGIVWQHSSHAVVVMPGSLLNGGLGMSSHVKCMHGCFCMFGLHGCVMNVQCFRLSAMLGHAIFWMHPLVGLLHI